MIHKNSKICPFAFHSFPSRRLHQLVAGRQAPRWRRTAAAPVRGRSGSGRRSIRHQRRRSRVRPAGLAPAGSAGCFADRHHRDGHLGLSARGDRVRRDLQRAAGEWCLCITLGGLERGVVRCRRSGVMGSTVFHELFGLFGLRCGRNSAPAGP